MGFAAGLVLVIAVGEASARLAEAFGPPVLRWYDASTQLKVDQMEKADGARVVFAGTSMVWQGMVPAEFTALDPQGRTAYNAALAGGIPAVMEPWLLEEVVPRLNPDLVVWGLSSMDFSASYGEANLERYRDALATRTGTLAAMERATARVSALVRYRSVLRHPGAMFGSDKEAVESDFDAAAAVLGDDGERMDFEVELGERRAGQIEARLAAYRIDEADIEAIYRTTEALRQRGIEVILVEMPVPSRYVALHPNGAADVAAAHETINAIGDIFDLEVVDLRYGFTDDDFVDFTHLTETGAARLTASLTATLSAVPSPLPRPGEAPLEDDVAPPSSISSSTTTTTTLPDAVVTDLIATANRAIRVFDGLFLELMGGTDDRRAPGYWTSAQHAGRYEALLRASDSGGYDVVMLGSSLAVSGFDPAAFVELDGRSAFNAGLSGMSAEHLPMWLDSVLRLADPQMAVYALAPRDVQSFDRIEGSCIDGTTEWKWSEELRETAFDPIEAITGVRWEDLFFGDPAPHPGTAWYRESYDEFGGRLSHPPASPEEIQASIELHRWEGPFDVCPERLEVIAGNVARLKDEGLDVVIVFMPLSGGRVGMFEGGREEIAGILDAIEAAAVSGGADAVLDFSALLSDDQFRDLSHADGAGARVITTELAARLADLGL